MKPSFVWLAFLCGLQCCDLAVQAKTNNVDSRIISTGKTDLPEIRSIYFVVAERVGAKGEVISSTKGVAFAFERFGEDCILVTAQHVVKGAKSINVYVSNNELAAGSGFEAKLKWENQSLDLAVLRIRNTSYCSPIQQSVNITPIGEQVFSFLHAPQTRGMFTNGIIGAYWMTDLGRTIVCDMRVYPGQSGSPLINKEGKLIGMVVSRTSPEEMPAAFALPLSSIVNEFESRKSDPSYPLRIPLHTVEPKNEMKVPIQK